MEEILTGRPGNSAVAFPATSVSKSTTGLLPEISRPAPMTAAAFFSDCRTKITDPVNLIKVK